MHTQLACNDNILTLQFGSDAKVGSFVCLMQNNGCNCRVWILPQLENETELDQGAIASSASNTFSQGKLFGTESPNVSGQASFLWSSL
jgi:hypothetical protein